MNVVQREVMSMHRRSNPRSMRDSLLPNERPEKMQRVHLFFPVPRIVNRSLPIIQVHVHSLRRGNTAAAYRTSSPQSHEFQILLEAQK
jgi:hypothetical protein